MSTVIFPTDHTYIRYDDDTDFPDAWLKNFLWRDRDDYLAWVTNWKTILRAKIQAIRDAKATRRNKDIDSDVRGSANAERQALRIDCFNLFMIRKLAKRRAEQQHAERRKAA